MTVTDASAIVNELYVERTGNGAIDNIDSSALVDIGKALQNVASVDVIYAAIADKVGKVVIKNRPYMGKYANLWRDGWEFGSIMETLRVKPLTATTDPSYNPQPGMYPLTSYAPETVVAKYFTDYENFEFIYWKPTDQLWSAFRSMDEMVRFLSAIETAEKNSLEIRLEGLAQTAVNNAMAQTYLSELPSGYTKGTVTTNKAVNVLKLYNDGPNAGGTPLTEASCLADPDFMKFFVETVLNWHDRLQKFGSWFNLDGEDTFSNKGDIDLIVLSNFANAIKVRMQSEVYHNDLVQLPNYDTVAYWQASGTNFDDASVSSIDMTVKDANSLTGTSVVQRANTLAVMFDRHAVGINCEKRKTTAFYHPDLDQTKFFDKYFAQYYNDFSENYVVFFIEDTTV